MPDFAERESRTLSNSFAIDSGVPSAGISVPILTVLLGALPLLLVWVFPDRFYIVMDVPSYLVLHNVSEFFSVMVALSIFGVAWYSHEQSEDRHALFLGISFLGIGLLDFMHALGYSGMPAFITPNSPLKSTQYWIAARLFMAVAFLLSAHVYPTSRSRWLTKPVLMAINLGVVLLVFVAVTFFPEYIPATYIQGVGLTPFKTVTEYLIIGLLAWACVVYWRRSSKDGKQSQINLLAALILCILSEVPFASYQSVFDTYNVIGHLYKIAAFYVIYLSIFSTSVKLPYVKLQQANDQLWHEIAERKRAEEELAKHREHLEELVEARTADLTKANALLETANKELEEFCYSISHDLRVPLRAIDGFSQILLEDYAGKLDADGQRVLNVVRDSTKKMSQLIDDILAFSRIGRQDMAAAEVDMNALVRDALKQLEPAMAGRDIKIDIAPLPPTHGDAAMLRRVWSNLLDNAVKFTKPKPNAAIEVGARTEPGETVYFVKDNGVGFDMQYVGKLFGVFQRLHGPEEFPGTGIGLALVKRIVVRHGGRVWAEGKVDEGASVYFALPARDDDHVR